MCPAAMEIWRYFTSDMIPVIRDWQLEGDGVSRSIQPRLDSAVDIINGFFSDILDHMEKDMSLTDSKVNVSIWIQYCHVFECQPLSSCLDFDCDKSKCFKC